MSTYPKFKFFALIILLAGMTLRSAATAPLVETFAGDATDWRALNGAAAVLTDEEKRSGDQSLKVAILFPERQDNPKIFHAVLLARTLRDLTAAPVAVEVDISGFWINPPPSAANWTYGSYAKPFLTLNGRSFGYQEIEARGSDKAREFAPRGQWRTFRFELPKEIAADLAQDVKDGVPFAMGFGLSAGAWGSSPITSLAAIQSGMVFYYDNIRLIFE